MTTLAECPGMRLGKGVSNEELASELLVDQRTRWNLFNK